MKKKSGIFKLESDKFSIHTFEISKKLTNQDYKRMRDRLYCQCPEGEVYGEIYDAIAGTFFICGAPPDSENFTSLKDEQVDYWLRRFAKPEFFVNINGQIICVPVEDPCQ